MIRKGVFLTLVILVLLPGMAQPVSAAPPSLPDVAFIEGIVSHGQTYALSCESRSTRRVI